MMETETPEALREIDKRVAVEMGWKPEPLMGSGWYTIGTTTAHKNDRFTRDPAAADLVRLEIERRGWVWDITKLESCYSAHVCRKNTWHGWGELTNARRGGAWSSALCLAFLAACDATKEQEKTHDPA